MIKDNFLKAFEDIAQIPHGSGHTEDILRFLQNYAKERGYQTVEDAGNLVITIPASPGYEEINPVILQGHMDMVTVAEPGYYHDFLRQGLKTVISEDGEWLSAQGTSLGGDDGVAIAYMMMIMNDKDLKHPKLYCVITRDEEINLLGALDFNPFIVSEARSLINLDSEEEGYLISGSSGSEIISATYSYDKEIVLGKLWTVEISGLSGGHSGDQLSNSGAHAAKILAQILGHLCYTCQIRLVDFECVGKDNVISTSARAAFYSPAEKDVVVNNLIQVSRFIAPAYSLSDPNIKIDLKQQNHANKVFCFSHQDTASVLFNIQFIPYGVQLYQDGKILASSNVGKCTADEGILQIRNHIRFANPPARDLVKNRIIQFLASTGGLFDITEYCPPWLEKNESKLREKVIKLYKDLTGKDMKVVTIPATLECGVFSEALPELDIVSFGPTVQGIHTSNERLNIPSALRIYELLIKLLEDFKENEEDEQTFTKAVIERSNGETLSVEELYENREPLPPACSACEFNPADQADEKDQSE